MYEAEAGMAEYTLTGVEASDLPFLKEVEMPKRAYSESYPPTICCPNRKRVEIHNLSYSVSYPPFTLVPQK